MKNLRSEINAGSSSGVKLRILEAAVDVLADRGYHDANVDDIVKKSGSSKGGFYFHFPSKERMVIALMEQQSAKLVEKVEISIAGYADPEQRLQIAIETLIRTFSKRKKIARILLINVVGNGKIMDSKFLHVRERFANLICRELDNAVKEGLIPSQNTGLASHIWLEALHEVLHSWLISPNQSSVESMITDLTSFLFRSVQIPNSASNRT